MNYDVTINNNTIAVNVTSTPINVTIANVGPQGPAGIDGPHTLLTNNPHNVTKTQVGLGNADNTSDANKPVSTAQATADALVASTAATDASTKANAVAALLTTHASNTETHGVLGTVVGTISTQTLTNKTIVAASNTITTSVSGNLASTELNAALAELQTDIDTRQATLVSGTNIKTVNGNSLLGSGDVAIQATVRMPFYTAAGTLDSIPLIGINLLPFFVANGTPNNIPLAT
jgi:hypothetical protein